MKKKTMEKKSMETIYEEEFDDSLSMITVSDSEGEPECEKTTLMAEWRRRDEEALESLRKAKEETLARRRERALRHYNNY